MAPPQGQILEHLEIKVGDKKELVDVGGFVGTPIIDCRIHGNQYLIYIKDLSEQTEQQVWLCDKCRENCFKKYTKLNDNN